MKSEPLLGCGCKVAGPCTTIEDPSGDTQAGRRKRFVFPDGGSSPLGLEPLTPKYRPGDHEVYAEEILHALSNPRVRNIALSGNYGVGKSSILSNVVDRDPSRVVEISLSALSPIAMQQDAKDVSNSVTNRIQREIVKQLLYREPSSKTPASRFKRIEHFDWVWEIGASCLIGVSVAVGFLLLGWSGKLASALSMTGWPQWIHLNVLAAASLLAFYFRYLAFGRITFKQLSAGPATVTLDSQTSTYFDQYLDEIFYFFDVSGRDIVVFEDIDRFDDTQIFETLRSLNTLLNSRRENPVRFIYAMKDSIFENLGTDSSLASTSTTPISTGERMGVDALEAPDWKTLVGKHILSHDDDAAEAHLESGRANRTKFFDLVIPVVPFITHNNAKNVVAQMFPREQFGISVELIDLVSRYTPDMRLLKNVRNEFIVFQDRIRSGDGELLKVTDTEIFAMMLYKSTHLSDFEDIRLGASRLDALYKVSRKLVANGLRAIGRIKADAADRLSIIEAIDQRAKEIGGKLLSHISQAAKENGAPFDRIVLSRQGSAVMDEDIESAGFWLGFIATSDDPPIEAELSHRDGLTATISFTRKEIKTIVGELSNEELDGSDREYVMAQISALEENLHFLRRADMHDLIARPDLHRFVGEDDVSMLARKVLPSRLAYELVRGGHINRNFALSTAVFHGTRTTSAAVNFIVHHVQRADADIYFQLDQADSSAVIDELGVSPLADPPLYNITLMDHLLRTDGLSAAAEIMISSVAKGGEPQVAFFQAYVSAGEFRQEFVRRIAASCVDILPWLVEIESIDESLHAELVGIAITSLMPGIAYRTDNRVSLYLAGKYAMIPSVVQKDMEHQTAQKVAWVFGKAKVKVEDLAPLSDALVQALASGSLYAISRANIDKINGNDSAIALDVLRDRHRAVYGHLASNLSAYLDLLEPGEESISANGPFTRILSETAGPPLRLITKLVHRSAPTCFVNDLREVPPSTYPALAAERRFPTTVHNVIAYLDHYGKVDLGLAAMLRRDRGVKDHGNASVEQKARVALAVLQAGSNMTASLRASTVRKLGATFKADEVPVEPGELYSLLVKKKTIPDEPNTYDRLRSTDWATRELYIAASPKFAEYITPALVGSDLFDLMESAVVPAPIKDVILDDAGAYIRGATPRAKASVARLAIRNNLALPVDIVLQLAASKGLAKLVVSLVRRNLGTMSLEELKTVLVQLGEPYKGLSSTGKGSRTLPYDADHLALVERLHEHKIVSSWKPKEGSLVVSKKHR